MDSKEGAKVKKVTPKKYSKSALKTKPNQVAAYSARKAYKKTFKEISPDTDLLIDQMLNPEDCNEVTRWPNTYGLSSVYKCKTVLNAKFDSTGRSCIAVAPTISSSIFATWGASTSSQLGVIGDSGSSNPYSFQQVVLDKVNEVVAWNAPFIFNNGQALVPFPAASRAALLYPIGFTTTGVVAPNLQDFYLRFRFPNAIANQAQVRVNIYGSTFGLISTQTQSVQHRTSVPEGYGCDFFWDHTQLTGVSYLSVELIGTNLPYRGPVYGFFGKSNLAGATASVVLPNHAQHVGVYDIKDAATIAESASQAFVLSQSMLLTAEMSDINNGGMLAVARIPAGSPIGMDSTQNPGSINTNNWYEWISSLTNNNYDGAVKDGGYAWYLGEDETAYFYRPIDNYFSKELPYLAAEFTVVPSLVDAATVRIKICSIVQFTTTASIYDQRPSGYISDRDYCHQLLSLVPAAYSNDGHKESIKRVLKVLGLKVKDLLKDPKTYATAGAMLGKLAPAALALL